MSARRFVVVEGDLERGVVVAEGVRFGTGHVVILANHPQASPVIYGDSLTPPDGLEGMSPVLRAWPGATVQWLDPEAGG